MVCRWIDCKFGLDKKKTRMAISASDDTHTHKKIHDNEWKTGKAMKNSLLRNELRNCIYVRRRVNKV